MLIIMPDTLFLQFTFHLYYNCFTTLPAGNQMHELAQQVRGPAREGGGGGVPCRLSEF